MDNIEKINNIERMNKGKLNKSLDRKYRFSTGVMPLRDYLESKIWVSKTTYITNTSKKRINLEYKQTIDKRTYTLWDESDIGTEVPKMVYDTYNIPEKIKDNRIKHEKLLNWQSFR